MRAGSPDSGPRTFIVTSRPAQPAVQYRTEAAVEIPGDPGSGEAGPVPAAAGSAGGGAGVDTTVVVTSAAHNGVPGAEQAVADNRAEPANDTGPEATEQDEEPQDQLEMENRLEKSELDEPVRGAKFDAATQEQKHLGARLEQNQETETEPELEPIYEQPDDRPAQHRRWDEATLCSPLSRAERAAARPGLSLPAAWPGGEGWPRSAPQPRPATARLASAGRKLLLRLASFRRTARPALLPDTVSDG